MSDSDRYKGELNAEYALIMRAWPLEKEARQELARVIEEYARKCDGPILAVELGSGSGESTEYILEALGPLPGLRYVSLDLDGQLIENQRARLAPDIASGRLEAVKGDGLAYLKSLPDQSVDVCTASWFLHNFKKDIRGRLLREAHRVLKPGGLFAAMDKYVPDDADEEKRLYEEQLTRFARYDEAGRPELRAAMIAHENEDRTEALIMRLGAETNLMREIGFAEPHATKRFLRDAVVVART